MSKVIEIENLSKVYDLGLVGTGTLAKDLNRAWASLRGKPDPYATLVELNDRTQKSSSNMVYALKDINFSVDQGEVLGIIGKNGAGKSTLLKILSQITSPSTGSIKIKGRVASLLEVGTGMHPEMTARENIYLNGSLMGMRRLEITSKLDEIVHFAGIRKYIDTPIKRFSSGMKVRLGFAVAAFLEPEILIVDEVLAVGDAEFQNKAIGKMKDVSKGEGRTVLFVSHNMTAVKNLCKKCIILERGTVSSHGNVEEIVGRYLSGLDKNSGTSINLVSNCQVLKLNKILTVNDNSDGIIRINKNFKLRLEFEVLKTEENKYHFNLFFTDGGENTHFVLSSDWQKLNIGSYTIDFIIPEGFLNNIFYSITIMAIQNRSKSVLTIENAMAIEPREPKRKGNWLGAMPGVIRPKFIKTTLNINNE